MQNAKISLTIEDFNYSPFVETYMKTLLENRNQENFDDLMQMLLKKFTGMSRNYHAYQTKFNRLGKKNIIKN